MMKTLLTGQNIVLQARQLSFEVNIARKEIAGKHLELFAFLTADSRQIATPEDVIFRDHITRGDNCVSFDRDGSCFRMDLDLLPEDKICLSFALSIVSAYGEGVRLRDLQGIETTLLNSEGSAMCCYSIDCQDRQERALKLIEIYRYKGQWKIRALGAGYEIGLSALSGAFGAEALNRSFGLESAITTTRPSPSSAQATSFSGTGFCVNRDGFILTNHHVIDGATMIEGRSARQKITLELVFSDARNDIALLRSQQPLDRAASFCGRYQACAGEPITSIGYPLSGVLGSAAQVTTGNVSCLVAPGDATHILQFTAPIQSGNSGGPLLDAYGHISGMVCSKLNAATIHEMTGDVPQNVNFAIKASAIIMFLHALGVEINEAERSVQKTPAELSQEAFHYVFQILCH